MSGIRKTLKHLHALQSKFEDHLTADHSRSPGAEPTGEGSPDDLRHVPMFGSNPGNLRMLAHVPATLSDRPSLVVALHGCGQSAAEYERGTGWSTLADAHGFVVVYPEQQSANNPNTCFSWFQPGDIGRDRGEAQSIHQMIDHAVTTFGVDRRQVYITGLSAGGAMAAVLLATYPETFAGGAIIAGLPYGCAASVQQAFEAMFTDQAAAADELGDRVRAASPHGGPWPKISVWHGTADSVVKPSNAEQIVRQWADVHNLAADPTLEEQIGDHSRRVWSDADGQTLIESFTIVGMAHGVPLAVSAEGAPDTGYGAAGPFFLDAGISSTHHIARFWGLREVQVERPDVRAARPEGTSADATAKTPVEFVPRAKARPQSGPAPSHDANAVITAAFRSAGLPAPDFSKSAGRVDAAPIIEAALRVAGLRRR